MLNGLTDQCSQTKCKGPVKSTQHFNATSCNIVGSCCDMLWRSLPNAQNISQHQKMFQQKFDHFQTWSNTIQHFAMCCYRVEKHMQHIALNIAQSIRKMLHWSVACVWPIFRQLDGIDCDYCNQSDCIICDKRLVDLTSINIFSFFSR